MHLEMFLNFDGNCREAAAFYARVFRSEVHNLMTYAEVPQGESGPVAEADKDRVMYAGVPLGGMTVMMMDVPTGYPYTVGNNINPTMNLDNKEEIVRIFHELKEGGEVMMEPQPTFYSELYCMVKDKFGIQWHLLYYVPAA